MAEFIEKQVQEEFILEEYVEKLAVCNAETDTLEISLAAFRDGHISKEQLDDLTSIHSQGCSQVPTVAERRTVLLNHIHTNLQRKLDKYLEDSEPDVLALAKQALRERFIEQDVIDHLISLHPQVPIPMRRRYLLTQMRVTLPEILNKSTKRTLEIKPYKIGFSNPLEFAEYALKDKLIDRAVLGRITALYPKLPGGLKPHDHERIQRRFNLRIKFEKPFQKPVRPNEQFFLHLDYSNEVGNNSSLSHNDLSQLNEKLVDYAYKWENIGTALKFQPHDLSNIQAMPLLVHDAPKSYLTKLLKEWLLRAHEYTLPCTMDNLKEALRSKTVGLGALANKLQLSNTATTNRFVYSWVCLSLATTEPGLPKYDDIYLNEGESTLLEIQITSTDSPTTCQWFKDGIEFTQNKSVPILCLHDADIDWSGCKFSCLVEAQIKAAPITVHVSCPLDEFKASLADVYKAQPELPKDTWPPVGSKKFINLALIKQEQKVNHGSEYVRQTIRGDIDDILHHKQENDYNELYDSLKSGQLVLIEGRPGCGKTTFVHKLTRDWANKTDCGAIRLLLLVSLRVLNTFTDNLSLSDILKLFPDLEVDVELIKKRKGKGVCFIFDGLDEFSPSDGDRSIVYTIINKIYLSQSIVIVASRPAAIAKLRNKAHKVVEVLGFLNDQIFEYFDHYPFSSSTKSAELKSYLTYHPNVLHMCYLPIHAVMVAFLFDVTGSVPRTETEMYGHFTRCTLMRNLAKSKEIEPSKVDVCRLTDEQQPLFRQICQLAFEKTLSKKQVLDQDEVNSFFKVKKHGDISLGLITVDSTAGLYSFKNIYTFLHLTFQEYLAAYHISTLSKEEQDKLIQEHEDKNHMLVVWKFYCGLVTMDENAISRLILNKAKENIHHSIHCAYESQQTVACVGLLNTLNYHMKFADLIPDYTAVGYIVNISDVPVKLSLVNIDMSNEAVNALLSEVKHRKLKLCVQRSTIDATQVACIRKLLTKGSLTELYITASQKIDFEDFPLTSPYHHSIITALSIPNISRMLYIREISFSNLKFVNLKSSIVGFSEFEALADGLKSGQNLEHLDVSSNGIDNKGAILLAQGLKCCKVLQRFIINYNKISPDEVRNILLSIKDQYLKVKDAEILHQNMITLLRTADLLESFTNLQLLDITLEKGDVEPFCRCSKSWKGLIELRVIFRHDMEAICHCLEQFNMLEKLCLRYGIISAKCVHYLKASFDRCLDLKVDLQHNEIGSAEREILLYLPRSKISMSPPTKTCL